jgi:hypothetical protein
MKVYIAGPYTIGKVHENVTAAIAAGDAVAALGHVVFIPHLTHYWHALYPHKWDFWMAQDLEWLRHSDALLRLPGTGSKGADKEEAEAVLLGMKVFRSVDEIPPVSPKGKCTCGKGCECEK